MSLKGLAIAGAALAAVVAVNTWAQMQTGHGLSPQWNVVLLVVLWMASWLPGSLRRIEMGIDAIGGSAPGHAGPTRTTERPQWVEKSAPTPSPIVCTDWWLTKPIHLEQPITTPGGSRVSSLTIAVDFSYDVTPNGSIRLFDARLALGGSVIAGSELGVNATTNQGEAFHWYAQIDPGRLHAMLYAEIETGPLAKTLAAKWRDAIYGQS